MRTTIRRSSLLKFAALLATATTGLVGAVASGLVGTAPTVAAPTTKIEFVSPSWLKENGSDPNLRILDVRPNPLDYIGGHAPAAVHIADGTLRAPLGGLPVQYQEPGRLGELLAQAGVTDKSKVLVYSDGRDVLGATMVAYVLERIGHSKVAVLDGGLTGLEPTQPSTKEFPKYTPGKLSVRDNPSIRVSLAEVRNLIGKPNVVFLDPRPEKLFQGEEKLFVRNGHIPGARNIPWPKFTVADNPHKLKPLADIKALLAEKKIDPSKEVIVTCSTGREATLQYIVLKHLLGYPNVRVYEGSWSEYSAQPDLPVETGPEKVA